MTRSNLIVALIVALIGAVLTTPVSAQNPSADLQTLFADYDRWSLEAFPEEGMKRGDYTFADQITDRSLPALETRQQQRERFLARLGRIPWSTLGPDEQVSHRIFDAMLSAEIDGFRYRGFLAPIGTRFGVHQDIPRMADRVRFENADDYTAYLARLALVPRAVRDTIELMKVGLREGRVPPRIVLKGVPEQLEALLGNGSAGGLDRLAEPFDRFPSHVAPADRAALRLRFDEHARPDIRDAIGALRRFLVDEYVPGCRESIAIAAWPDGEAYYAHRLRAMTTTDLGAREIHELGLSEVARIRGEMMGVIKRSDFMERRADATGLADEPLFSAFIEYLRTDPRFYHRTADDLLAGYRAICKEIDGHMPRFFGLLPRQPYGVKEVPAFMAPRQTTAYYSSGDLRNAQAGFFYANTYALDQRPKYEMIPLALHEAVPGHHHQTAVALELENVPEFRRDLWFTAYGEGWALYAERLGIEMGLYDDPYDDFGRLLYEMWRACRLVVDPGLHVLGWSRQRAMDFMAENTALSELNIVNEIDRYIAWPGQATAYKIGELRIRELRARGEKRLGADFDLRGFHDLILEAGPLPLDILETRVNRWIDERRMAGELYD